MRILWMSDSPASPSGFGNITRFVCSGLAKLGHQVSLIAWQGSGRPVRRRHYTIYSGGDHDTEDGVLLDCLCQVQPDVLVTLADPWRVDYLAQPAITHLLRTAKTLCALYYPIDSDMGRGRLPARLLHVLQRVDLPIVMSRYGLRVTRANGVMPAYIPGGVDTDLFAPPRDKVRAKRALGYEGRFVILSDARNQIRKLLPRTLEIFRRFAAGKDDVLLHLHCDPYDPAASSADYCYDLLSDVKLLGLSDKVRFTRDMSIFRGISLPRLAALYQAADVHLLASFGEGFGMPTLQAAAAGVVPLAPACSASRELVEGHGEAIRVQHFVRGESGLRRALVDMTDAVEKLERLYQDRSLLRSKSQAARRFAESYAWERLVPQWNALLQREVSRPRAIARRRRLPARGRDAGRRLPGQSSFTLPVTPPPAGTAPAGTRITGRVHLASAADIPIFRELGRIFPRLSGWSSVDLARFWRAGHDRIPRYTVIPAGSPSFRSYLATSTLALDRGGVEPALPVLAAEAGVPLVGVRRWAEQGRLWPDLTLETSDIGTVLERGRRMLSDHGAVAEACALARKRIVGQRRSIPRRRSVNGPLVSVVIPFYNGSVFLANCVRSVRDQKTKCEIILVDDGSTDDSLQLARRLSRDDATNTVTISQKNQGPAVARNTGLRMAQGRYVCFLDVDDQYAPTFLSRAVRVMESDPAVVAVFCGIEFINSHRAVKPWQRRSFEWNLPGNVLARTEAVRQIGGFPVDPAFRGAASGEGGAFRSQLPGYGKVVEIRSPLYKYRVRRGSHFDNFLDGVTRRGRYVEVSQRSPEQTNGSLAEALETYKESVQHRAVARASASLETAVDTGTEYDALSRRFEPVEGFLHPFAGFVLYQLARHWPVKGRVVEIGGFKGRSTCWLAAACREGRRGKLAAVDHFRDVASSGSVLPVFKRNLRKAGLADWVTIHIGNSADVSRSWREPIRLLFIDGDHSYESAARDFLLWSRFVPRHGLVAFHDIGAWPGVTRVCQELSAQPERWRVVGRFHTLQVLERVGRHGAVLPRKPP